jgi:hypothetical protein
MASGDTDGTRGGAACLSGAEEIPRPRQGPRNIYFVFVFVVDRKSGKGAWPDWYSLTDPLDLGAMIEGL